jgi:tetratricopeptide (TPR) repeat protein
VEHREGVWQALLNLGTIHAKQGRRDEARACYEECLTLAQTIENPWAEGAILSNLGNLAAEAEDADAAEDYWRRALEKLPPDSPPALEIRQALAEMQQDATLKWQL